MAKHTMQYVVPTEHLDVDPTVRDYAKIKLADRLMMAVRLEASFGENIVSLGPVSESQNDNLSSVTFEQSVTMTPLVRCRDCKHRIVNEHYGEKGYLKLKAMCELDTGDPFEYSRNAEDDDWFCADGERKGGHG